MNSITKRFLLGLAIFLMVTQCVTPPSEPLEPLQVVKYKTIGDVELALHIFNPPDHRASDKKAAIVFFFGGGWNGGSPSQFFNQSKYLASRGMVSVCAEYRVKSRNQTSPKECVMDGKSAVRWLRVHCKELGIDPNRLAAGGGSAGGHVAAATGTCKAFDEENENLKISSRPNALVLFNPVIDNSPDGYGYSRVKEYWQDFSPMHNIDEATPPTILFLGTNDSLIPVATVENYKKRMEEKGRRCDLHLYADQPHGFFNKAKYYETLLETDRFLTSLGFLEGEPTLQQ